MGLNISTKNKKNNHVVPSKWNKLIKNRNTFILDARKPFEYEVGSFNKAVNPKVNHFREFPKYLNKLDKKKEAIKLIGTFVKELKSGTGL